MADRVQLSKFLSLLLRHRADHWGLDLDEEGFIDLSAVWAIVSQRYPGRYDDADLHAVLAGDTDGKRRFEVVDGRIRALYGHSKVRRITYPPVEPPEVLYHGTNQDALVAIRRQGLLPMKRQYVHLSTTVERASTVALRRTAKPLILTIRAGEAFRAGIEFYHPEPLHYLAWSIPAGFIDLSGEP